MIVVHIRHEAFNYPCGPVGHFTEGGICGLFISALKWLGGGVWHWQPYQGHICPALGAFVAALAG